MVELEIQPSFLDSKANVLKPHYSTILNSISSHFHNYNYLFTQYFLWSYYESFAILGAGDTTVNQKFFKPLSLWSLYSRSMVLNWGWFCPQGTYDNIEAFLIVTTGGGGRMCHCHLVGKSRDAVEHPMMHRKATHNKELSGPKCQ